MANEDNGSTDVTIFIEDTSGNRYECTIPLGTQLGKLAADFFEDNDWPTRDANGRGQRAVVELVDPENPERTKRLQGDQTADRAGLFNGAVLRIFPESIAGIVDATERISALVADHNGMRDLVKWNKRIKFEAIPEFAPTHYVVEFDYPSFRPANDPSDPPVVTREHRIIIELGSDYPRKAPLVYWETPIFHPNIRPSDGVVCLGVLKERYLPSLGLARLVTMLAEMAQYRNFDSFDSFNRTAAEWAVEPQNWPRIEEIGGYPFQMPVHELIEEFEKRFGPQENRGRIVFKRDVRQGTMQ